MLFPSEPPPAARSLRNDKLLGATRGLVATRQEYQRAAARVEQLSAQVHSIAFAGLAERVRVLGEPLIYRATRAPEPGDN
jgi:hypothetical protein